MARLLVPAAAPGAAPIDGGEMRYWRAPAAKLASYGGESRRGGVEEIEGREGMMLVCRTRRGEASIYRGDEVPRRTVRSSMAPAFGVAKGQGEDGIL